MTKFSEAFLLHKYSTFRLPVIIKWYVSPLFKHWTDVKTWLTFENKTIWNKTKFRKNKKKNRKKYTNELGARANYILT